VVYIGTSRHPAHPPSQPSPTSTSMTSFVGCMRNLHVTYDASPWPGLQLYQAVDVERGCRDLCATSTFRCANLGRCTDNYVSATCDCYGTGFEGSQCQRKGLSWYHYNDDDDDNDCALTFVLATDNTADHSWSYWWYCFYVHI